MIFTSIVPQRLSCTTMFDSTVFRALYFHQYRTIALGLRWAHNLLGAPCAPVSYDSPEKLPGAPRRSSLELSVCAQYRTIALKNKKVKNRGLPLALLVGPALFRLGIFPAPSSYEKLFSWKERFLGGQPEGIRTTSKKTQKTNSAAPGAPGRPGHFSAGHFSCAILV